MPALMHVMELSLDPTDPVPLYHQIVQAIRWRIGTGALSPGDRLPPLRTAAEAWDVHLHTVRHAYQVLAEAGFVDARPGAGTRVLAGRASGPDRRADAPDTARADAWLAGVAEQARRRFGWTTTELAGMLRPASRARGGRAAAMVVECNRHQCADLADQISDRWDARVGEWLLDDGVPPAGTLIGTRFHEAEMRRAWPDRGADMRFVTLRVDPAVGRAVQARRGLGLRGTILLCERDTSTARQMARDIAEYLPPDAPPIRTTTQGPTTVLDRLESDSLFLVAPRRWEELPFAGRLDPRVIEARHQIAPTELESLGAIL